VAFAGARFVDSLLQAIVLKKTGITECTYVKSDAAEGLEYFSTVVELGPEGVQTIHPLPTLNEYEKNLYAAAVPELKASITKGVEFVTKVSA
jgi:malate dehydrogenase